MRKDHGGGYLCVVTEQEIHRRNGGEENMLTADFGHRLPVRVLKQVVYPFMIQKLSGTQLTK